jgi:hypothetical protein
LRCKDYFQAQKFFECLSLSGDPEQRKYKPRLPLCITSLSMTVAAPRPGCAEGESSVLLPYLLLKAKRVNESGKKKPPVNA